MAKSDYKFSFPFRVRYSEIDAQGVVFNAHYLTYFDTAIAEYFRNLDFDYQGQVRKTGEDFHTVRTVVEYAAPINFDEDIDVHTRIAKIGRTSMTFLLEIHPKDTDDLRATGEVVWVNADQTTHKSTPLPENLVELIRGFEGQAIE